MKNLVLIGTALVFSSSVNASLSALSSEYLESGSDNESQRMELEINSLEKGATFESKAWQLTASGKNTKSKLERSSSLLISSATLLPNDTETTTYNLTLSKEFFTGTTVSLSNSLVDYQNNANSNNNNKGFTQTLSLEQDLWNNFLGRRDSLTLDIAQKTFEYQKTSTDFVTESNLYTFVSDYLKAKLDKANVELKEAATERAKKRLSLIKRRVRDGLSEKVDLYSAQTQSLAAIEGLRSEIISLESSLESLSKKVHREVNTSHISNYGLTEKSEILKVEGSIEDNKNFSKTKKQIDYLIDSSKKAESSVYPALVFGGAYTTNNYETKDSPISDGMIGSENNELTVGLTLTWNIGSSAESLTKEAASIQLNKARMESRKVLLSLKEQENSLVKRQTEVEVLIKSASKRLALSNKTLKEYKKIDCRGKNKSQHKN